MSTEPGKNKGGSGPEADGAGKKPATGSGSGKSGKKPAKTVAAAAKSGRDETTVDIDREASTSGSGADTTRTDLAKIEAKDADTPEIAPVKDTADDTPDPAPKSASSAPKSPPKSASSSPSSSSSGPAGWAKPAEPPGSVSAGRTEPAGKPFNSSGPAAAAAPAASASSGSGRGGFAGTVLKDRPATSAAASTSVAPANSAKPANGKPARKAQLQLARLEPWSVMKFSFVMSLVCFVVLLVAVIVLYTILSGLGVFDAISDTINSLTKEQGETTGSVDAGSWFSFFRVFGYTVLVGALNVMLITALSTVGSVIYNLAADLVGGVEVTLKEAE
ncbi:DUF3566 domain-containing protein [Actinomadura sp. NAK00032]|uniref:DUF3566 domain-containing protein n=1 Tax=Actinomadura sp. NAK00032 TaxID=2742128 RepID=UPI0020C82EAA|nr:DUF3566 domain-containing protein [Actinomadura sp. NAK00032]